LDIFNANYHKIVRQNNLFYEKQPQKAGLWLLTEIKFRIAV